MADLVKEAEELKKASFGKRLLRTIGFIYENKAVMYLQTQAGDLINTAGYLFRIL